MIYHLSSLQKVYVWLPETPLQMGYLMEAGGIDLAGFFDPKKVNAWGVRWACLYPPSCGCVASSGLFTFSLAKDSLGSPPTRTDHPAQLNPKGMQGIPSAPTLGGIHPARCHPVMSSS